MLPIRAMPPVPRPLPPRASTPVRVFVALAVVGVVLFFFLWAPDERPSSSVEETVPEEVDASVGPPRCAAFGPSEGVLVGPRAKATDDSGFEPFAAEVGRGTAVTDGFAVGVKHEIEGQMHGAVALVTERADRVQLLSLSRARGDVDAPVVVRQGEGWVAAMLEPNASGVALRLLRTRGEELQWGAEIEQGRDESWGFDVAFGSEVGVVAWDDVTAKQERGVIMLATVAVESLEGGEDAREVSSDEVDAELPRVVPRPSGFWLAYLARSRKGAESDAGTEPEGRYLAERIQPSWIELVPLDARGRPDGQPSAITSREGFAIAYDVAPASDGGLLVTWRDDDTPSGSHGGRVTSLHVSASGAGQEQTVAAEDVGAGVPTLLPGWVALHNGDAALQLAPVGPDGQLLAELRVEPLLEDGHLVAARADVLLVAHPAGRAVRLTSVRCDVGVKPP